jgi:tetratricopeptide (TPR) repeat protein
MTFSTNRMVECPTDEVLSAYLQRTLPEHRREAVSRHLFLCNTCLEYTKLLLWDSDYEQSDDNLDAVQLNQPVEVTPVMADVLERFKGFREHRRNFPARTLLEIGIDGLQVGQVWRTRVEDVALPKIDGEETASIAELNSDAHLVLITNPSVRTRRIGPKTYHVIRVLPIDTDTEYAMEGDLVVERAESPLGYSFMAQLWNEQEMLQENLESCLGEFREESHPRIWKSLARQGQRPLVLGAFSLENIIINGLFYDPALRYRAREYEETQYLRAPVESLMNVQEKALLEPNQSIWKKWSTEWRIPRFSFGWLGLSATVAVLLAVVAPLIVWRSMRGQLASRDGEIARLKSEKTELEKRAAKTKELEEQIAKLNQENKSRREIDLNNRDFIKLGPIAPSPRIERPAQVAVNDAGKRIGLSSEGQLTGLDDAPVPLQSVVKEALTGSVDIPEELRSRLRSDEVDTRTRGTGDANDKSGSPLLYPVATTVRSNRPTFKWKPLTGAKYYVVRIFTSDFRLLASSEPERLTQTEWTPAQSLSSQTRYYRWQVDVISSDEKPADEFKGRFVVLDEVKEQELRRAEEQYPNSHLLLGSLYTKSGLFDEAEREFQMLLKENPRSSLVKKLLRDVQRSRRGTRSP